MNDQLEPLVGLKAFCNPKTGRIVEAEVICSEDFISEEEIQNLCSTHDCVYKKVDGFYYVFSKQEVE